MMRRIWTPFLLAAGLAAPLIGTGCVTQPEAPARAPIPEPAPDGDPADTTLPPPDEPLPERPTSPSEPPATSVDPLAGVAYQETLSLCPRMGISNAPASKADRTVIDFAPFAQVTARVRLARVPTTGVCLSSGFGPRGSRLHKGIDLYSKDRPMVYAAGAGTVREAAYRDDYGNQVVIEHGEGVYTRYAHLARLEGALRPGLTVELGTPLGPMSNTAAYRIPVHLHFEILTGEYDTPKGSFGLVALDPFDLPHASDPGVTLAAMERPRTGESSSGGQDRRS